MDFFPDDEQLALARSASDLLAHRLPPLRELATMAWSSRDLLRECASLGWFGLGVDAAAGGSGATVVEETLVFRELGRALAPGPFLSTLLAARVALAAGDQTTAAAIINGDLVVALAEPASATSPTTHRVFDHHDADFVLSLSATEARLLTKPQVTTLPCIDELTPLGACDLADTTVVASTPEAAPILRLGWVLTSALLTGIAEATLAMSVEYLKVREQFGRPIGSFQALKHQAANMAVQAEVARSITTYAALAMAEAHDNAALYAMSARVLTHQAALGNARGNVQHHGAIGVTFEHNAHLYVKRVHVLGHVLGGVGEPLGALIHEPSPLGPIGVR
jgi:alkylation response protein AidB-like acyl-CoA dehydrogenase